MEDEQDFIQKWITKNPHLLITGLSIVILIYGILMIIGALRDWDWLYKPDTQFTGNLARKWYPRKVSYNYGRKTGRIYGFIIGLCFFIPLGLFLGYLTIK